jgi:hypothetical protein
MTTGENTGGHTPSTPREATFGMKRAAEVAGVSVSTIRRNKELLREHGAVLNPDGWQVPMSALIASGLMRRTTPPDQPAPAPRGADVPAEAAGQERVRELEAEAVELRHALELEAERRRSAEALARERGEALEAERMALRMLTTGTAAPSVPETPEPGAGAPEGHQEPEKPVQAPVAPRRTGRLGRALGSVTAIWTNQAP